MPTSAAVSITRPRRLHSVRAIVVAFVANAVLALATDQLFHVLAVYPPWGEPMPEFGDNLLALSYRCVYGVLAGYIVARLAPSAPLRHVNVLAVIGTVLAAVGAVVAIAKNLGPAWYPILLAVLTWPTLRLGGALDERRASSR